jgi:hypothetical protein
LVSLNGVTFVLTLIQKMFSQSVSINMLLTLTYRWVRGSARPALAHALCRRLSVSQRHAPVRDTKRSLQSGHI